MTNHLSHETSPYLLQHADNPVDWFAWTPEALAQARLEDKPIFLSIGYAACHWCHVMAHESFEDPVTAAFMNQHFINIKVDREERPDLDYIYMQAVVAITGNGGGPMSVFLTPDGLPFYGGTYFPPVSRYQMPAFIELLQTIAQLWRDDRSRLLDSSTELTKHLQKVNLPRQNNAALDDEKLIQAAMKLEQAYDWKHGGWGQAPKFPQPMTIDFLLRSDKRGGKRAIEMAVHALQAMAKGGMYDVVGGGFARYSVDNFWRTPHFEKMLYDNAQLALVYLHGYLITKNKNFRQVCEETLDFILREMTHPAGGFYSSLDADSEGEEGKFYLWTAEEIQVALGNMEDSAFVTAAYGITQAGNFESKNILQRVLNDDQLAEKFAMSSDDISTRLSGLHKRLLYARSKRVRPSTDDKVLVSWNALAMAAFAEAGRYLGRTDYTNVAVRNARFVLDNMISGNRLLRSWRAISTSEEGHAHHNAFLEDYAGLIIALLALYQSDPDPEWYVAARTLADEMIHHYTDPHGGFFDTRDDHDIWSQPIAPLPRPKEIQDNATPSGNALAATALLQLSAYEDHSQWRVLAEGMLSSIQEMMVDYPTAFSKWLCAADFALGPITQVAVVGESGDPRTQALLDTLWDHYRPRMVAAISTYPPEIVSPALLKDRPLLNNKPTAYVCQGFVCLQPTNSPADMTVQLAGSAATSIS